jgi:metal-responsive CopG/Arc/MetJ family transcriptional regulator
MGMLISLRLDTKTVQTLTRMAGRTGKSRSQLIREAIHRMNEQTEALEGTSAYDQMAALIGVVDRGPGNRAAQSEVILRAMFRERGAARRARG